MNANGDYGKGRMKSVNTFLVSTVLLLVAVPSAYAAQVCGPGTVDPDRDGWGWEDGQSCRVQPPTERAVHPACDSHVSDPDGDGFGWENEQTCRVVAVCETAQSDTDGDGWGYENGLSCSCLLYTSPSPRDRG